MQSKIWLVVLAGMLSACGPFFPDSPSVTRTPSPFEQIPPAVEVTTTPLIAEPQGGTVAALTPEATPQPSVSSEDVFLTKQGMIIYRADGNLCLQRQGFDITYFLLDGASVRHALVSDDGRTIAVIKSLEDREEVWLVDTDGSNPRLVFDTLRVNAGGSLVTAMITQIEFIPFTRQLLLTTGMTGPGGMVPNEDLYRIDANSNMAAVVLTAGNGGGTFTMSPDGRLVAIVAQGRRTDPNAPPGEYISMLNANGTGVRLNIFSFDPALTYSEVHEFLPITWHSQSKGFWVAIPPHDTQAGDNRLVTYYIPADGAPATVIGAVSPVTTTRAVFSPDGAWVAFGSTEGEGKFAIRIVEPTGRSNFVYYESTNRLRFEKWEGDSRHFVFREGDALKRGELDGTVENLTNPAVPALACTPPA